MTTASICSWWVFFFFFGTLGDTETSRQPFWVAWNIGEAPSSPPPKKVWLSRHLFCEKKKEDIFFEEGVEKAFLSPLPIFFSLSPQCHFFPFSFPSFTTESNYLFLSFFSRRGNAEYFFFYEKNCFIKGRRSNILFCWKWGNEVVVLIF